MLVKRQTLSDLPRPGDPIEPEAQRIHFADLIEPTEDVFRRAIDDLLDKVVITDNNVTRREEQLDQLCNLLLLKLESDKQAKSSPSEPVFFRPRRLLIRPQARSGSASRASSISTQTHSSPIRTRRFV